MIFVTVYSDSKIQFAINIDQQPRLAVDGPFSHTHGIGFDLAGDTKKKARNLIRTVYRIERGQFHTSTAGIQNSGVVEQTFEPFQITCFRRLRKLRE